jgi:anaerobic selenocysteine-containing dehydrogenase
VLPGPTPLAHSHYDLAFNQLAIRNVAKYSPPAVAREPNVPEEWETLLRLTGIVAGQGPEADIDALDAFVAHTLTERELAGAQAAGRPVAVDSAAAALAQVAERRGPERLLDVLLRAGPYGDGFGARDGLTLAALKDAPHGIDLGELRPRIPEVLRTPSGKIELAPAELLADLPRLAAAARRRTDGGLVLIGRRHLRSNNSWMHNLEPLVRGPQTCTVRVHPEDAARHGLQDGALAAVSSRVGRIELPVELDDGIRPGVVSIPHGWGHDQPDTGLAVARRHAGANSNRLTDETLIDPLSGNAVLNGIPVQLTAATP